MLAIEFVSYDGSFPNLCRGVLVVKVNGKVYRFGHHYCQYDSKTKRFKDEEVPNLGEFWTSGGGFFPNYDGTWSDEWRLSEDAKFPDELSGLEHELLRVFNENVRHGCCGGCL